MSNDDARAAHPAGSGRARSVVVEGPGVDEVTVVPWPLMLRRRLAARVRPEDRSPWLLMGVALFGLFTVGFTVTLLAVSIPRIADDLHGSESTLTWVFTGPMLAFGVVGPALGKAGDLWGHKRLYLIGVAGAGLFAGLASLAWNPLSLIVFRVFGAGIGAATGPAGLAILNRLFDGEQRVRALGWWSMVNAGGPVLGVVAGGPIVEQFGWRWIFAAQVPLCAAGCVVAAVILPETTRGRRVSFDWWGTGLLAAGVTSLMFAVNRGPVMGWSAPLVVAAFVLSPVMLLVFWRVEQRRTDPLIPLHWFRTRNFAAPVMTQFFTNWAYMGGFILTPLLLHDHLGYGEGKIGLLVICRPLAFAVAGPLAGYVAMWAGERSAAVAGALFMVASMIALAAIGPGSSDLLVIAGLALSGIGLGISSPALTATLAATVDDVDFGVAGATQQLVIQVGTVAGVQVMQTIQTSQEATAGAVESYGRAYLAGAGIAAVGVVIASLVRSTPREQRRESAS